jgi:hypothetical protein
MCKVHPNCDGCPIQGVQIKKDEGLLCSSFKCKYPELYEKAVMKWAAEHPEPKYPTWREWHEAEFPDAGSEIAPCHFMPRSECCKDYDCRNCNIQPIPAHIAEKLGIKPIEED